MGVIKIIRNIIWGRIVVSYVILGKIIWRVKVIGFSV